ncbi:RHS repeat domain-containing protein [Gottfriedia sp. NPDC057991]|uniref:RHS repeat domain-containing protein n=1 Tax=Gottfriedia sp. NPDC057991 TaxID=3346298 RepID=UPI0036D791D4
MYLFEKALIKKGLLVSIIFALIVCLIPFQAINGVVKAASPTKIENAKIQRYDSDHPNDFNADKLVVSWTPDSEYTSYRIKIGLKPGGAEIVNTLVSNVSEFKYYKSVPSLLTYYFSIYGINKQGVSSEIATDSAFARNLHSASLVATAVPESMEIDSEEPVSITVLNDGLETWSKDKGYRLVSDQTDYFTGKSNFQLDSEEDIKTGESKTFTLPFYAGKKVAKESTKWQMVKNNEKISISVKKEIVIKDSVDKQDSKVSEESNATVSTTIADTQPPTGDFTINNGNPFTNSQDLTIRATASDNSGGVIYQSISSDGINYSTGSIYPNSISYHTTAGDGQKRVYMKLTDGSGNVKDLGYKTITLDQTMPKAELKKASQNEIGHVEIRGTASDATFDSYQLQYVQENSVNKDLIDISNSSNEINDSILGDWRANVESGFYTIYLTVTDAAGNTSYDSIRVLIGADFYKQAHYQGIEDHYQYKTQKLGNGSLSINLQAENGVIQYPDLKMATQSSISYQLIRTLNNSSLDSYGDSSFGGWSITGNERIETDWDKQNIKYYDQNGELHEFYTNDNEHYVNLNGSKLKLSNVSTDYDTVHFQIVDTTGLKKNFIGSRYNYTYNIDSYEDLAHNKIQFAYDSSSKLIKIYEKNPLGTQVGASILLEYKNNSVSKVTYGDITVNYSYVNNLLTKVSYEYKSKPGEIISYSIEYTYYSNGAVKSFKDPNGNVTQFTFENGNIQVTEPDGKSTSYHYSNDTTTVTSDGKTDTYYLNTGDYRQPVDTLISSDGAITNYQYNNDLNCISETTTTKDNIGNITGQSILTRVYESPYYFSEEKMKDITFEDGVESGTEIEYTKNYEYTFRESADPWGFFTLGDYAVLTVNNVDKNGDTSKTKTIYDPNGYITSLTDETTTTENGNTKTTSQNTSYSYDDIGRVTSIIHPNLSKETYEYSGLSVLQKKFKNKNNLTPFSVSTTINDLYGNLTDAIDGNGNKTSFEYNPLNDSLLSVTDAKGKVTTNTYDNNGNLLSSKDALNHVKNYSYDVNNQALTLTMPIQGTMKYAYNNDRQLTKITKFSGITSNFTYDDYKNVTSIVSENDSGNTLTQINRYDENDNVIETNLKDQSDNILYNKTFRYDRNNNITSNTQGDNLNFGYEYNDSLNKDRVTKKSVDYLSGYWNFYQEYTYTSDGKLSSIKPLGIESPMSYTYQYGTGDDERIIHVNPTSNGELFSKSTALNSANELDNIKYTGAVNLNFTYLYDAAGNITSETTSNGETVYQYDANNQLINETLPDGTSNSYTYNAVGNRTSDSINGITNTYTYNDANQIVTKNGVPYIYDVDGNLTQDENFKYEYNVLGQQTRVTTLQGVEVARYEYDENNLRTKKTVGNETHEYYYESNNLSVEIIRIGGDIKQIRYYQWDSDGKPLGMYIKEKAQSGLWQENVYHFVTNYKGDVLSIVDNSGNIVGSYTYDSYGNILSESGILAGENTIRFAGYYYDNETQHYYLQARYYNQENGNLLALDPHPGDSGVPISQNGYTYSNNNPVMFIDMNGKSPVSTGGGSSQIIDGPFKKTYSNLDVRIIIALLSDYITSKIPKVVPYVGKAVAVAAFWLSEKATTTYVRFWTYKAYDNYEKRYRIYVTVVRYKYSNYSGPFNVSTRPVT